MLIAITVLIILAIIWHLTITFPLKVKLTTRWKKEDSGDRYDLTSILVFTGDEAAQLLKNPENEPSLVFQSGTVELSCYSEQLKKRFQYESFSLEKTLEAYEGVKKRRFFLAPMPWQMIGWISGKSG
jgi:hypothetical protein